MLIMRKYFSFLFFAMLFCIEASAQNINLDSVLDAKTQSKEKHDSTFAEATFQSTRLINGQTVETTQGGVLNLEISHRFGKLNEGFYNMFGLDVASMRLGFDYGITNRFEIGVGRSTFEKQYDGFLKYRLLWQDDGKKIPVSVTLLASMMLETDTVALKTEKQISVSPKTADKLSYAYQVLMARKISPKLSLQLVPTLIHENLVDSSFNSNNFFAVGLGATFKVTKSSAINIEYYYEPSGNKLPGTYNSFSIGYEIQTAGHVFQLHISNSTGMTEKAFIAENDGRWSKGDIHFGFNISRVFTIKKQKQNSW